MAKPKKETQSNGRVTNPAMTAAPLVSPTISVSTSGSLHSQQSLSPRFTSPVSDSTSDTELVNGRHLSGSQSGCSSDVAVEAVYDTPKSFCSLDNPVSTFKPDLTESIGSGVTVTSAEASIQKSTATVASYAPNASPPRRSTDNATNHTQLQVMKAYNFVVLCQAVMVVLHVFSVSVFTSSVSVTVRTHEAEFSTHKGGIPSENERG